MPISLLNRMRLQELRFCLLHKAGVRARSRQTRTALFIAQPLLLPVSFLYFVETQTGKKNQLKAGFQRCQSPSTTTGVIWVEK